jgi:NAD(P)H-dependent flavin oxidoreductase YrpB (nitropropane dioxygenase family)
MLKTALCDLLGIRYPIIQGGMAYLGTVELVSALAGRIAGMIKYFKTVKFIIEGMVAVAEKMIASSGSYFIEEQV